MKKDIFSGKVKPERRGDVKGVFATLILITLLGGTLFLLGGLLYEKVEFSARILLFVLSGVSYALLICWPPLMIWLIRLYPKYKNLTVLFINHEVFLEGDKKSGQKNKD